jgi:hypothetical protein
MFNTLRTRQPYLAADFEFHYFTNYTKLINYIFFLNVNLIMVFSKKYTGGQKVKGAHYLSSSEISENKIEFLTKNFFYKK